MKAVLEFIRRVWKADTFSATAFLVRAAAITVLFGFSELLGLREYTTFLSGTSANLNVSWQTASLFGLIHLLLYVGFILFVPIFLLTAVLLTVWSRWGRVSGSPSGGSSSG
jgi:hypothetical protein